MTRSDRPLSPALVAAEGGRRSVRLCERAPKRRAERPLKGDVQTAPRRELTLETEEGG